MSATIPVSSPNSKNATNDIQFNLKNKGNREHKEVWHCNNYYGYPTSSKHQPRLLGQNRLRIGPSVYQYFAN